MVTTKSSNRWLVHVIGGTDIEGGAEDGIDILEIPTETLRAVEKIGALFQATATQNVQ